MLTIHEFKEEVICIRNDESLGCCNILKYIPKRRSFYLCGVCLIGNDHTAADETCNNCMYTMDDKILAAEMFWTHMCAKYSLHYKEE